MPQVRVWQYDAMREYVRDCADGMGLRDWVAYYYHESPKQTRTPTYNDTSFSLAGAIKANPYRREFCIWLPPDWYELAGVSAPQEDQEKARDTVIHELLHVHFRISDQLIDNLQTNLGEGAWGVFHDVYVGENERLVDLLTTICAKLFPLPAIPAEAPKAHKPQGVALRSSSV